MTPSSRLALFTTPVAELGRAADQQPADAWRRWGRGAQWSQPTASPRIGLAMAAWSWPTYRADQSSTRVRVWRAPATWDEPARWTTVSTWPALLPWAPGWQPAWQGEDRGCLIDDDHTAVEGWEALNLRPAGFFDLVQLAFRTGFQARAGDWIADALARRTRANAGRYVGRGMGDVPKRVGIVTATEVASGDIGHAVAVTGITQWGPGATFVAPATRVEHPTTAPKGYPPALGPGDRRAVPHGVRLALDLDDAGIAAWVRRRAFTGAKAHTAATFVRALRDWGAIVSETGVGDPVIETTGLNGPDAVRWRELGVTEADGVTLLDGLPWDRLFVVGGVS